MVGGVKQTDAEATRGIIDRSRKYSKMVYDTSKRYNNTVAVGGDERERVITNPFQCSHRFKVVASDGVDVIESTERVLNPKTNEWEDKTVHRIGDVIVFEMDGSKGMNSPAKDGWLTDNTVVKCGGLRYLTKSIAPQKNEKLVYGERHALDLLEKHRAMCRKGRRK